MSALYPRIPHLVAQDLFNELVGLSVEEASHRSSASHKAMFFSATGGRQVAANELTSLRHELVSVARSAGYPDTISQVSRSSFDSQAGELLLRTLDIAPAEAASREVWAFVGCVLAPDIVLWRFPAPPGDRMMGTDLRRHAFARLWWRAWTLEDVGCGDALHLFRALSEDDHVHLFEPTTLGGNPVLARALARCILNEGGAGERTVPRRMLVRDALKKTLRLTPFVAFEALNDDERSGLLTKIFAESLAALAEGDEAVTNNGGATLVELTAYEPWRRAGGTLDVASAKLELLRNAILAVVDVEGPVIADRAYRLITGLERTKYMPKSIRSPLNHALQSLIDDSVVVAEDPLGRPGLAHRTVYRAGAPSVRVRERGPRSIVEMPPTELLAIAKGLPETSRDEAVAKLLAYMELPDASKDDASLVMRILELADF